MAKKPATRISVQTYLGNCLEQLVAESLASLPWHLERSPAVPAGLISPDFFRPDDPAVLIAVTSTPTGNSFQKKKWRYVHEVFSSKQHYRPRPIAINVQLSPPGAVQPNDERILRAFFDAEISPPRDMLLAAIASFEGLYQSTGGNAKQAVVRASKDPRIERLDALLRQELTKALKSPREVRGELWAFVAKHSKVESARAITTVHLQEYKTNLRSVCFGSVLVSIASQKELFDCALLNRSVSTEIAANLAKTGTKLAKGISGPRLSESFVSTVRRYGADRLADIIRRIRDSDEAAHIIRDLENVSKTAASVAEVLVLLRKRNAKDFANRIASDFKVAVSRTAPKRLDVLDFSLLAADVSSTAMDRILSTRHPDFSSFNRVRCMISAYCQGRSSYGDDEVVKIATRIWAYLTKETDVASVSDEVATHRVLESRAGALKLLGNDVNPAQVVFEELCRSMRVPFTVESLSSCLGDLGIPGRVAKVERLYRVGDGDCFVKVLSGYKGGFEHKAEELAARGWILRYRADGASWKRSGIRLGFVHEGDWSEEYLSMLLKSGWDWQLPLEMAMNAPTALSELFGFQSRRS